MSHVTGGGEVNAQELITSIVLLIPEPDQVRCSVVQYGAMWCIVLQCVAESIESIQLWPVPYSRSSYAACPYMSTPHLCVSYLKTLHAYFNNVHSYLRTSHAFF